MNLTASMHTADILRNNRMDIESAAANAERGVVATTGSQPFLITTNSNSI
jgi:hypothetical protein